MLNAKQIEKMQKKVGKKVDKKIEKRNREEKQQHINLMITIRNEIQTIQKTNDSNYDIICEVEERGEFAIYRLNNKTNMVKKVYYSVLKIEPNLSSELNSKFFEILELNQAENLTFLFVDDKILRFYRLKNDLIEDIEKMKTFMEKYFADIMFSSHNVEKRKSPKDSVIGAYTLGVIYEEFQKEFPDSSMTDFISAVNNYKRIIFGA